MAKELISRYMVCKPTAASVGNGTGQFNHDTIGSHLPVTLSGPPDTDDGAPYVKVTEGNTTPEIIFGKFTGITGIGRITKANYQASELEGVVVTVAVEGEDIRFARSATSPAVTSAEVGKMGIQGGNLGPEDYFVESAAHSATTRGVIIGGNSDTGTTAAPAFYRVNFKAS